MTIGPFRSGALALLAFFSLPIAAHADTYTSYSIADSSGSIDNIGFTNNGNSMVVGSSACHFGGSACYETFTPPNEGVFSADEPTLDWGSGSGEYVLSAVSGGLLEPPLTVKDLATGLTTVIYTGAFEDAIMNTYGDVGFVADNAGYASGDENMLAVNVTARVTPEPSSVALLGTGLLGAIGLVKRRFE